MSKDHDSAIEKVLFSNLERAIDFVKFAEAKNAALLTFSSAWVVAIISFLPKNSALTRTEVILALVALGLLIVAMLTAIISFLPRNILSVFYHGEGTPQKHPNLLFFGDIRNLPLKSAASDFIKRYTPDKDRTVSHSFAEDISVQIVVNSRIACIKYCLFEWGAFSILTAFILLIITGIIYLHNLS